MGRQPFPDGHDFERDGLNEAVAARFFDIPPAVESAAKFQTPHTL